MPKPFRLALVGAGMVTQSSHLPAALASDKVQVVALVEPMRQRAEELARWYGIAPVIVPQVQDVLGAIDGAVIATPNDTHMRIALTCLQAGVATLIEKPLASTYAEGEAIVRAGQASGTVVAVGYMVRFRENILLLDDLLKAGYFGTVRRFAHQAGTIGGWTPMSSYNLSRKATGGGVLVVTGTHIRPRLHHAKASLFTLKLPSYPGDLSSKRTEVLSRLPTRTRQTTSFFAPIHMHRSST